MTEEQKDKAFIALMEANWKKIEMQVRAEHHLESVEAVSKYNLPYRVYLKQTYADNEVRINPFYPFPGVPTEYAWKADEHFLTRGEYLSFISKPMDRESEETKMCFDTTEVKRMRDEYEAPYRPCRTDTAEGLKNWKKYFVKFLLPYEEDMKGWKAFDFFGTTDHTEAEADERRQYYLSLIAECRANPEAYELQPILFTDEDYLHFCFRMPGIVTDVECWKEGE